MPVKLMVKSSGTDADDLRKLLTLDTNRRKCHRILHLRSQDFRCQVRQTIDPDQAPWYDRPLSERSQVLVGRLLVGRLACASIVDEIAFAFCGHASFGLRLLFG